MTLKDEPRYEGWMSFFSELLVGNNSLNAENMYIPVHNDWNNYLVEARLNRVTVRATKEILRRFGPQLPEEERNFLQTKLAEGMGRTNEALNLISQIQSTLESKAVGYTIFKTTDDFPDIGDDIDILVREDSIRKAEEAIRNGELKPFLYRKGYLGLEYKKKGHFFFDLAHSTFEIELYPKFTSFGEQYLSEHNVITNSRKEKVFGDFRVRVPSPEDSMIINYIHVMYRHGGILKLLDLIKAVQTMRRELNWKYIFEFSDTSGTRFGLLYFLFMVKEIYANYSDEPILSSTINDYVDQTIKRHNFKTDVLPFRLPVNHLCLLYLDKCLNDIKGMRPGSAVRVLQKMTVQIIGRILFYTAKMTRHNNLVEILGLQ